MPRFHAHTRSIPIRRARSDWRDHDTTTDRDPYSPPDAAKSCVDTGDRAIDREIARLAAAVVSGAVKASETIERDPMLGDLSTAASLLRSVVSRAGSAIPDVIAHALSADEGFMVLRERVLPMTKAAAEIVDNNQDSVDVEVTPDTALVGTYAADLIVIDRETRHATVFECRRGSVLYSTPKTSAAIRTLRIVGLSARKALEADGYRVASVSVGVIDRYGRSGHEEAMSVGPDALDDLFGVPVRRHLDAFDARIRERLAVAVTPFLAKLLPSPEESDADRQASSAEHRPGPTGTRTDFGGDPDEHSGGDADAGPAMDDRLLSRPSLSRLVGPAERRRAAEENRHPKTRRNATG